LKKQSFFLSFFFSKVTGFDEARVLFKSALSRHVKAQQFYVLDGYVTDHVALCRDVSAMYKWLSQFEEDEKRKLAM
jgi:KIF-binding protein